VGVGSIENCAGRGRYVRVGGGGFLPGCKAIAPPFIGQRVRFVVVGMPPPGEKVLEGRGLFEHFKSKKLTLENENRWKK
jgi:hypothetical protein